MIARLQIGDSLRIGDWGIERLIDDWRLQD
jgi:hypothetical protein